MTLKAMPPKSLTDQVLADLFENIPLTLHDFPQGVDAEDDRVFFGDPNGIKPRGVLNVQVQAHDFPQQSAPATNSAEDRGLGTTGNLNPDVLFRIARAAHLSLELDKKSDEEIAQMLLQTVWAEMHTGTLEAELVDQAITRLRKEKR